VAKKGRVGREFRGDRRSSGLVITLLGVTFLGFMASQWAERQRVADIAIVGASGLSRVAVQRVVDTLRAKVRKTLTLADVRASVEALPYVRNASVYYTGVRTMTVEIDERVPVAHVVRPDGTLRYVDATGTVLPNAVERTAHNVPVLQAVDGSELKAEDVRHLVDVLIAGSRTLHSALYQGISEVRFDPSRRTVEIVTDDTRWRLGVMTADRASIAFADMDVFWRETAQRLNMASVSEVDLRWRNQVVLRYHASQRSTERAA
jgi:cell division septal protein FtsQ